MKYVQLRAFRNVAIHGGFSHAAKAMGLTQPAVSDQVLGLEQDYDVLLFDRQTKKIKLTPKGERLLEIVRPLFEAEARALEFLTESRELVAGNLQIIADSAFHVTEILSSYHAKYPDVKIELRSGNSAEVEQELLAYRADIGILGSQVVPGRFHGIGLGSTPIIAFCARDYPGLMGGEKTLRELARYPLVLREENSKTRQKLEAAAKAEGVVLIPAIQADSREAVREIVASGGGIGFVSAAEYGHDQRLMRIPIAGPAIFMEETVLCLSQRKEVRTIRAFMDLAEIAS